MCYCCLFCLIVDGCETCDIVLIVVCCEHVLMILIVVHRCCLHVCGVSTCVLYWWCLIVMGLFRLTDWLWLYHCWWWLCTLCVCDVWVCVCCCDGDRCGCHVVIGYDWCVCVVWYVIVAHCCLIVFDWTVGDTVWLWMFDSCLSWCCTVIVWCWYVCNICVDYGLLLWLGLHLWCWLFLFDIVQPMIAQL